MAVPQPSDRFTVQVPGHRAAAIATSVLAHAVVILGLVLLGHLAIEEEEPEPVRMVFVEPAPPPKLGVPDGGAPASHVAEVETAPAPPAEAPLERVVEPARPEPEPRLVAPRPEPKPVKPKPKLEPAKTKPEPVARAKPAPAPAGPAPSESTAATADGSVAAPRGVSEGHGAGVAGGVVGGRVGGLGTDLTPLRQAAVPPRVLHQVMPEYPESARVRGIEGQVVIEAVISRKGSVEHGLKVVQSIPALDAAAVEAFQRWRFSPARDKNGNPLRVILQAPVRFVLR